MVQLKNSMFRNSVTVHVEVVISSGVCNVRFNGLGVADADGMVCNKFV